MGKYTTTILELGARLQVFLMLNIYALGKILGGQFYRRGNLPDEIASQTLAEAGAFEIAWTFMGYSYGYILFIGISQLIGAWLLLWDRTKLLGVAILLPIMVNIVVFDIFFLDRLGALGSASLYLCQLLLILWLNRKTVGALWEKLLQPSPLVSSDADMGRLRRVVLALLLVGVFFTLDQLIVNLIGH